MGDTLNPPVVLSVTFMLSRISLRFVVVWRTLFVSVKLDFENKEPAGVVIVLGLVEKILFKVDELFDRKLDAILNVDVGFGGPILLMIPLDVIPAHLVDSVVFAIPGKLLSIVNRCAEVSSFVADIFSTSAVLVMLEDADGLLPMITNGLMLAMTVVDASDSG